MAHKDTIEVLARAVILDRRGRILACRNRKGNYYYLPGGHVEHGETAREAVARELVEECSLSCRVGELCLVSENRFGRRRKLTHEYTLVFNATTRSTSHPESNEDYIDFAWLSRQEIRRADFRPHSIKAWLLKATPASLRTCEYISESAVD